MYVQLKDACSLTCIDELHFLQTIHLARIFHFLFHPFLIIIIVFKLVFRRQYSANI